MEDTDTTSYSLSFVTPPLLGPVLLLGGVGVINADDMNVKVNGTKAGFYSASATIPYLGVLAFWIAKFLESLVMQVCL